jgi:hypothetical protein
MDEKIGDLFEWEDGELWRVYNIIHEIEASAVGTICW